MKSRYLLLLPLLMGCSAIVNNVNYSEPPLEKYTNVSFYLKEEDDKFPYYYVYIEKYDEKLGSTYTDKEWNVSLDKVEHLFYSDYQLVKDEIYTVIYNEFYVKGNSSLLILYHYFK
jgi:hypothetical protein